MFQRDRYNCPRNERDVHRPIAFGAAAQDLFRHDCVTRLPRSLLLRQKSLNKSRIEIPRAKFGVRQYPPVQRNRRINSLHDKHSQRPAHA